MISSRTFVAWLAVLWLLPTTARANPEPPALYDARAIGMGGTGTAFLDSPAAVLHNPANLVDAEVGQFELAATNMIVRLEASFAGEGNERDQLIQAPLMFVGGSGRFGRRFSLGGALYMAMGFGGRFTGVDRYGTGTPCIEGIGDLFQSGSRDADYCASQPRAEKVTLVIMELAVPLSVRITRNLRVGVAARLPYGILRQQTSQDIFGALSDEPQGNFGLGYAQARSRMSGFGTPGVLLGATWDPIPMLSLAASYRSKTRVHMTGNTTLDLGSNELIGGLLQSFGGFPVGWLSGLLDIDGLAIEQGDTVNDLVARITEEIPSSTNWYMPHALEAGVALHLLDRRLLLSADLRVQLHEKANRAMVIRLDSPLIESMGLGTMEQRFDWKNVYGIQIGGEYLLTEDVALRLGTSVSNSATPRSTATQFGVPPGIGYALYAGAGFRGGNFLYDFAFSYGGVTAFRIRQQHEANGDMIYEPTCQPGMVIKTGCPGRYGVDSWFLGLSLTYRPRPQQPATRPPAEPAASEATRERPASPPRRPPSSRARRRPSSN